MSKSKIAQLSKIALLIGAVSVVAACASVPASPAAPVASHSSTGSVAKPAAKPRPLIGTEPIPEHTSAQELASALSDQKKIAYSNMWADNKGHTHITKCFVTGLKLHSYAPPAAPDFIGVAPEDIESIVYTVLPVGYTGDWHHAPGPQWVFVLSGAWEVESTDGTVLRQGPGEFQFNSDEAAHATPTDSRVGHLSRQIGDVPNVRLIITLKKKPGESYTNKPCVL